MGNEVEGSKHRDQTNIDLMAEMVSEFALQVNCPQMTNLMPRPFPVSGRVVLVELGIVRTQPEHVKAIEVIDLRSLLRVALKVLWDRIFHHDHIFLLA